MVSVDDDLDACGLRKNRLCLQLLRALIELAEEEIDERGVLENRSKHPAARAKAPARAVALPGFGDVDDNNERDELRSHQRLAGARTAIESEIWQTHSAEFPFANPNTKASAANGLGKRQMPSANSSEPPTMVAHLGVLVGAFPLSWSHYVHLLSVSDLDTRAFYEAQSIRGGWSVRPTDRQISTLFYERTAISQRKAVMPRAG